jgi:adenylosuccinate lyase
MAGLPRRDTAGAATATHSHQRSHITDSRFHGHMYATDASRRIFCDVCRLQRWLDVEAALAASQADVGMLPRETAEAIARAASVDRLDLDEVALGTRRTGHSLMALLSGLQHACEGDAGQFVHYGATTQDIQDTAQALEMRDCLDDAQRLLVSLVRRLVALAREHTETVMTGRTHARPALPITFGLKVASWIDELLRAHERLERLRSRALVVELFGGVGSMAAFGDSGRLLLDRFATRLGLGTPMVGWHASRDRVTDYVAALAMLAATAARVADEVRTLSRPELGELAPGWHHGKIGSSTMPHKRNPEECEQIVVLARLAAAQVPVSLQAMVVEHERDSRELRTEWSSVADASHYTLTALSILDDVIAELDVDAGAMLANATEAAADLATEQLMLLLVRHVGKQSAYDIVYEAAQAAKGNGHSLRDELLRGEGGHLTAEEIDASFDPAGYVGLAPQLAAEMIEHAEAWLAPRVGGEPS